MLTKEKKEEIIKKFRRDEKDTGSSGVQVALLTERISEISQHLKSFPKDKHSRRGLIKLVGKRRSFMKYLKNNEKDRYIAVAESLGIKK